MAASRAVSSLAYFSVIREAVKVTPTEHKKEKFFSRKIIGHMGHRHAKLSFCCSSALEVF